jgi:hypothetical protein
MDLLLRGSFKMGIYLMKMMVRKDCIPYKTPKSACDRYLNICIIVMGIKIADLKCPAILLVHFPCRSKRT